MEGGAPAGAPASRTARRKAAINRAYAAYIPLACGHHTDRETQDRYRYWRPSRGKYWCEDCSEWVKGKPGPERKPLPQEPLF